MESPPPAARPSSASSEAVRPRCSQPLPSSLSLLLLSLSLSLSLSLHPLLKWRPPPLLSVVSSPHRMKEKVTCPPEECTLHELLQQRPSKSSAHRWRMHTDGCGRGWVPLAAACGRAACMYCNQGKRVWPPAEFRSEEEKQQFYLSNWIIASAIVVGGAAIVFFAVATNNAAVSMVVVAAADIDIVVIDAAVACRHRCCGNNPL